MAIDDILYEPIQDSGIDEEAVLKAYYRRMGEIIKKYRHQELFEAAQRSDDEVRQNSGP